MPTIPTTQKALFADSPDADFVVRDTEVYSPGPRELLVKIRAAALNPVDWKIPRQKFDYEYPAIFGSDIAGDVVSIGEGVTRFKTGDKIFFQGAFFNAAAAFQQYVLAEEAIGAKIPDNVSYDDAATIPVAITCTYICYYQKFGLTPPTPTYGGAGKYAGIPFVVLGGSSSVGQLAIQLAKLSGFSPIITYASAKHESFLKSIGATHVIDRQTVPIAAFPSSVHAITGSTKIPWAYDAISYAETQQAGYDVISDGGKLGIVLPPRESLKTKNGNGKEVISVLGIRNIPDQREILEDAYLSFENWLRDGSLKPNRTEILPGGLKGIVAGLQRLEAGEVSGIKLVARPNEV